MVLTSSSPTPTPHNLDDSETISNDGGDGFGAVPSLVSQIEYGNANLDERHRFSAAFNYAFPGNSLNGLKGVVAKGWQFNGIIATGTGLPFSVTQHRQPHRQPPRNRRNRSSQPDRQPQPLH